LATQLINFIIFLAFVYPGADFPPNIVTLGTNFFLYYGFQFFII